VKSGFETTSTLRSIFSVQHHGPAIQTFFTTEIVMSATRNDFSKLGFVKTFFLPALLIFLVPVLSWMFFRHAEHTFDMQARETILKQLDSAGDMPAEERAQARAFWRQVNVSDLVAHDEEFAKSIDSGARFDYQTFRWMIRLSVISILAGIGIFLLTGLCVLLSVRSQRAQYISLSIGWQALRFYGAAQTIVQGIMLVALSFWVTALWAERYYVKLIFIAGAFAVLGAIAVIVAIFRRPSSEFVLDGKVIGRDRSPAMWDKLNSICAKVGTAPPDQIIVGIDDNFFVTETPVTVAGQLYQGRTLYLSLSLLKQLHGVEADAVLAHEMAHFSGHDTYYTKKIAPLLMRYNHYLQALYQSGITLPIFYFMNCFRALFELSLSKLQRQREFRADQVATEVTSPHAMAGALLRIAAYAHYRDSVQSELFQQEQVLESANVSERIEQGFPAHAVGFANHPSLGEAEMGHPFDSHPPMHARLEAACVPLQSQVAQQLLHTKGNGEWYTKIEDADDMEKELWQEFETQFRNYHEATLCYRFLPETDAEREMVVKNFPEVTFTGKDGDLTFDCEKISYARWTEPLWYKNISNVAMADDGTLTLKTKYDCKLTIKTKKLVQQQAALESLNNYYSRYLMAVNYQQSKQAELAAKQVEEHMQQSSGKPRPRFSELSE